VECGGKSSSLPVAARSRSTGSGPELRRRGPSRATPLWNGHARRLRPKAPSPFAEARSARALQRRPRVECGGKRRRSATPLSNALTGCSSVIVARHRLPKRQLAKLDAFVATSEFDGPLSEQGGGLAGLGEASALLLAVEDLSGAADLEDPAAAGDEFHGVAGCFLYFSRDTLGLREKVSLLAVFDLDGHAPRMHLRGGLSAPESKNGPPAVR